MKALLVFAALSLFAAGLARAAEGKVHRYLYVATPDGAQVESASGNGILVFDIDDDFRFVRRIADKGLNFTAGVRGMTGCLATHSLYYGTTARRMGRFDLETDQGVWERRYSGGCDRSAVTLDGSKIFAPTGWWNPPAIKEHLLKKDVFPTHGEHARYIAIESNPRSREMYAKFAIPCFWVTEEGTCLQNETRVVKRLPR